MDTIDILIFLGFVLSGIILGGPVGFALGQRSVIQMRNRAAEPIPLQQACRELTIQESILDAQILEEKR